MRVITCPVQRWTGTAQLSDPMTVMQVAVIERAISAAQKLDDPTKAEVEAALLPALLACVDKFSLANLPERMTIDNWPGTPRLDSVRLFDWLLGEVMRIYRGEVEPVPLA